MRLKRTVATLILFAMLLSLFLTGCGGKTDELSLDVAPNGTDNTDKTVDTPAANNDTTPAENKTNDTAPAENKTNVERKSIIVIKETNDELRDAAQISILSALEKAGYSTATADIKEIEMGGDESKSAEVVEEIKSTKPDVVVINGVQFAYKTVAKSLEGTDIPIVLTNGIEIKQMDFIDENDVPRHNITGVYTMPKGLQTNAFRLLQQIVPLNGKKAVFVTLEGKFAKEEVANNLGQIGVELKDFVEVKYQEEFTEATLKYNDDDEVGWILVGYWPAARKDGTPSTNLEYGKIDVATRKKPSVTYFEAAVKIGILCGLGVDYPECGTQAGRMAAKILSGGNIQNVKAEEPEKVNVVLNQKNATDNNIEFPMDILTGAYRVYTDYEGNYKN